MDEISLGGVKIYLNIQSGRYRLQPLPDTTIRRKLLTA
jgi:hypothetical protein